jgi:hypothetical protein
MDPGDRKRRNGQAGRAVAQICLAVAVTGVAAWWSLRTHPDVYAFPRSDFALLHATASAWLRGIEPYGFAGPGRPYDLPFSLVYPFTAVITAAPFTFSAWPDATFVAAGTVLFGFGLASRPEFRLAWFGVLTPAFIYGVQMSQWSAGLIGAALVPWFGWLLACKPTIGAALFAAFPSLRTLGVACAFLVVSVALLPSWPADWIRALPSATHTRAPITFWGGPLIALALWQWRNPRARLLVAMSAVPHTPELYESLPLFLIPSTVPQAALLAGLNWGVVVARRVAGPAPDYVSDMALTGQWMVWLLYLPCLAMIVWPPLRSRITSSAPPSKS